MAAFGVDDEAMLRRRTQEFHREVKTFLARWRPGSRHHDQCFETDLRMLLSLAFREAQAPFAWELNRFRNQILEQASLAPIVVKAP